VDQIALVKQLWLAGYSSGEIGRQVGVSRSSILGKLSRMGMLRNDSRPKLPPMPRLQQPKPKAKPKPKKQEPYQSLPFPPAPPVPAPPPEPAIGNYDLLDLKHGQCRWPEGSRPPYAFCGAPQVFDSSYCEIHHRLSRSGNPLRPVNPGYFRLGQQ
jgi:GcrA cell cycle regulator